MTDDGRANPASGFDRLCEWSIYTASHNKLGGAAAMPQHPFSTDKRITGRELRAVGQLLAVQQDDRQPTVGPRLAGNEYPWNL